MRLLMWGLVLVLVWCSLGRVLSLPAGCATTACWREQNLRALTQSRAREQTLRVALSPKERDTQ